MPPRHPEAFLSTEEPDLGTADADVLADAENIGVSSSGDIESNDNESTPLLSSSHTQQRQATPLPLAQLLLLAAVRLAEPIAFTQVGSSTSSESIKLSMLKLTRMNLLRNIRHVDLSICEPSEHTPS